MSAKNASLVIENESLKNDLKNLKTDYSNLLTDVSEARDYYNQLDISASKMVHRCEVSEIPICQCLVVLVSTDLISCKN